MAKRQRAEVEAAIEAAFVRGGDDEFEVLMEVTGAAGAEEGGEGAPAVNVKHSATGATALMVAAGKGRADVVSVLLANGADPALTSRDGSTARQWAARFDRREVLELLDEYEAEVASAEELANNALALSHYQTNNDADEVDIDLIESLLNYICDEGTFRPAPQQQQRGDQQLQDQQQQESGAANGGSVLGAVLVFVPGWDEIMRLKERLEGSAWFGGKRYQILALHSLVAPAEQRRVFVRPPPGVRKIVLSTNIAETAITIDDVVCVINSGRLKEKSYDPYTNVSTLQAAWISKASERQRRGRAGRCQPGVCFHLYSRQRSEALAPFQLPEIKRSPLDEMCLQVKLLESAGRQVSIADFLGKAVEPPLEVAVEGAIRLLEDIGALDESEALTTLGRHLAALPLPPALGKMLLYGCIFGCLDPILTVACSLAYRDPWVLPTEASARRAAALVRARLSREAGGSSDHLATVRAFNGWKAARGQGRERAYASSHYLSPATLAMVDGMRSQLLGELTSRGFAPSLEAASPNSHHADLVRSVLACGFYPQIGRVLARLGPRGADGQSDQQSRGKATLVTRKDERVRIHPTSINSGLEVWQPGRGEPQFAALAFYDEITRGESFLYVKSCTAVHPHALLLVAAHVYIAADPAAAALEGYDGLGAPAGPVSNGAAGMAGPADLGAAEVAHSMAGVQLDPPSGAPAPATALLVIDRWLKLRVPAAAVAPLMCVRVRLAEAFAAAVRRPRHTLDPQLAGAVHAASQLFLSESESAGGQGPSLGSSFGAHIQAPGRGLTGHPQQAQQRGQYPGQRWAQQQGGLPGAGASGGGPQGRGRGGMTRGGYSGGGSGRGAYRSAASANGPHGVKRSHSGREVGPGQQPQTGATGGPGGGLGAPAGVVQGSFGGQGWAQESSQHQQQQQQAAFVVQQQRPQHVPFGGGRALAAAALQQQQQAHAQAHGRGHGGFPNRGRGRSGGGGGRTQQWEGQQHAAQGPAGPNPGAEQPGGGFRGIPFAPLGDTASHGGGRGGRGRQQPSGRGASGGRGGSQRGRAGRRGRGQ
ncbi:hypothetical protein N2152v2_006996 [Parachlorella kessleri]